MMSKPHLNNELRDRIEQLAIKCRNLLEEAKPFLRNLPSFEDFPNGSCGDASLVLAWYLHEHGITKPITYVRSEKRRSHAWLEIEGWIIDITADQQSWGNPPVWILPVSQSSFHQKHEPALRRDAAIDKQDPQTKRWVRPAISYIRKVEQSLPVKD